VFDRNVAAFAARHTKHKGFSHEHLPRLRAAGRHFDVAFVDGSHFSDDIYIDSYYSWAMLEPGGVLIWDDYVWSEYANRLADPRAAIDRFLEVHVGEYEPLFAEWLVAVRKNNAEVARAMRSHEKAGRDENRQFLPQEARSWVMAALKNRRIVLAARPVGEPKPSDFRLEVADAPAPREGEVLLKTRWLSLDPYMRGRMSAAKSYAKPVEIGEVMVGGTVSEVVESKHKDFRQGDLVSAFAGWQDYALSDGTMLQKLDPERAPTALGVLGMPGMTAYFGLLEIGKPKAGETVVVSAASGAVGAVVGQIAKLKGCRAVGVAGGPKKCRYVTDELGFDACVDHRAPDLAAHLAAACPQGIDVYFENVGGATWTAVFPLFNNYARIPVCGMIAHYNDTELPPGPDRTPQLMRAVLSKRLTLRGFLVFDFVARIGEFQREMSEWVRAGKIKYREDVVEGLEKAPEALIGLLKGKNFGKLVVKVA
jgi:NADPH-dependent curcumin reductase CurA